MTPLTPLLSVVVPTIGRSSLITTLDSLDAQELADELEVLVVADVYGGLTAEIVQAHEHVQEERDVARYRWLEYDGGLHCFGQPQRMIGGRSATAPWVWYTQDDNIAAQGAVAAILHAAARQAEPAPIFARWLSPWREIIWRDTRLELRNIDADCLVLPRLIAQRVSWGLRYEGDYDAAEDAARLAGGRIDWQDVVISIARPEPEHCWWRFLPAEVSA